MSVIDTENLTKKFGDFTAVNSVNLSVESGEILGFLGPNGSGKTTVIRMLLGILTPTEGKIHVLGYSIPRQSEEMRQQIGYMSQKFSLYLDLTVEENIIFYAGVYGIRDPARCNLVLEQTGLLDKKRKRVADLSTGWKQRLALAAAMVHEPRLLFLDEPTAGVDPKSRRAFWNIIYELAQSGVTILVTTHYMDEAEYCSRVGIISNGNLLAIDSPFRLKRAYLKGKAYELAVESDLLGTLEKMKTCPLLLQTRLLGEHIGIMLKPSITRNDFLIWSKQQKIPDFQLRIVQPSLEDVFLSVVASTNL